MGIITISRGSFSKGRDVAEEVALRLNYTCVSREILIQASREFNIPEIKLARAIHDAPSIFERFTHSKERYVAHIRSTLLEWFEDDNVVYHGLAGHFFVTHISHVLKVRIIAEPEDRIHTMMTAEKITRDEALERLDKDDYERRRWSLKLYGIDTADPKLYDLVVHIHKFTLDDAVELICRAARLPQFQATPESQQALVDSALAAKIKAAIVDRYPGCDVTADHGAVLVHVHAAGSQEGRISEEITSVAEKIPGVRNVSVHVIPTTHIE